MDRIYKVILGLLLTVLLLILGVFLFENTIEDFLVSNARYFANYHWYMIALAFPETFFIKLAWDTKTKRAKDPLSGRFISYALFIGSGSLVAIVGFLLSINGIPALTGIYINFIQNSFRNLLISLILFSLSIPFAPVGMFIISSPAPTIGSIKSIFKRM